jgi:hypothetical protein
MAISDHRVTDANSFDGVASDQRQIAGIYFFATLDFLVDLAYEVARDFFRRPQLFIAPGQPRVAPLIAELHARWGADERVPSSEQRDRIFTPLFGTPSSLQANGQGDFSRLQLDLMRAAAAFAERVFNTGEEMLRERVRTTHRPFREYLEGLRGDSLAWSREEALPHITEKLAYSILRNDAITAVYGIASAPRDEWPFREDSNGDKLVEEISKCVGTVNGRTAGLTRERFSNLQRAALRGTEAIATIIDFQEGAPNEDLNLLITKVYSWGSAVLDAGTAPTEGAQPAVPQPELPAVGASASYTGA